MTTPEVKKRTPRKPRVASRKGKRLSASEKAEAITLWKLGETTLDELATKFGRNRLTFLRLFNEEGVTKGEAQQAHEKKVAEAVEAAAIGDVAEVAKRVKETKEDHYKMSQMLSKLVWQLIVDCKKSNKPFLSISGELKALRYASAILKSTREERYALLGLNKEETGEDKDPEDLVIREISLEEIQQRMRNQVSDDDFSAPDIEDVEVDDGDSLD
jgi:hypothetical protein